MTREQIKIQLYQIYGPGAISKFTGKYKLRYQTVSDWFGRRNDNKKIDAAIRKELKLKNDEVMM